MQQISVPFGSGVRVTWLDSRAMSGWHHVRVGERIPATIVTLGMATRNDDIGLTVSTSIGFDGHMSIDDLTIPWVAITRVDMVPFGYDFDSEVVENTPLIAS